jgi:hypothetical protein
MCHRGVGGEVLIRARPLLGRKGCGGLIVGCRLWRCRGRLRILSASAFRFWFLGSKRRVEFLMLPRPLQGRRVAWTLGAIFVARLTGWAGLIALELLGLASLAAGM